MMTCDEIDAAMTSYVDGEIDLTTRQAVEDHCARCGPCRARGRTEEAMRRLVRSQALNLAAAAPPSLRARCVGAVPPGDAAPPRVARARRWIPLSMAATLLLAVGGVFLSGQQERLEAAFAAQLAIDHEKCFTQFGTGHPPLEAEEAEARLAAELSVDLAVPAGDPLGDVVLVDARNCEYDAGHMAHLLYEVEGQQVSLFVVPDGSHAERTLEVVGHEARLWSDAGVGYVLVGNAAGPADVAVMDKAAAYMRAYER
ncbi:MAG: zf-HC2 domain-containing protein [Acidobacteria bacterium]|nr:zf-HC2 domain-containing protein [Acidobacteriota bacterium]